MDLCRFLIKSVGGRQNATFFIRIFGMHQPGGESRVGVWGDRKIVKIIKNSIHSLQYSLYRKPLKNNEQSIINPYNNLFHEQ